MATNTVVKCISQNGDQKNWTLTVENLSAYTCYNVEFTLSIPNGIELSGPGMDGSTQPSVEVGTYDPINNKWVIGTLSPYQKVSTNLEFTVTDTTLVGSNGWFELTGNLSSSCYEGDSCNNDTSLILQLQDDCTGFSECNTNDSIDISIG